MNAHREVVVLGDDRPAGWLAPSYERRYRRMAASRMHDGPAIVLAPLRSGVNHDVPLPGGPLVRFTSYPEAEEPERAAPRPGRVGDPATDPRAVFDVFQDEHPLRVVVRRVPYAPLQGLLVPLHHLPQEGDAALFRLAFAFLRGLGHGYTGTFNVGGRTHDRFHVQFFKGSAPLWDHLASGSVRYAPVRRGFVARGAWRADVPGWPCPCELFGSADPRALASMVAERTCELAARHSTYDLCFRWERDELRVLLFPRAAGADEELPLYPTDRLELGRFGALELAGWVLSIRDRDVYQRLVARPEDLARRYHDALRRIGTGWAAPDDATIGRG